LGRIRNLLSMVKGVILRAWKVVLGIGAAAGVVVTILALFGEFSKNPPITEQIDGIKHAAATKHLHGLATQKADFHGSRGSSYFFAFRPNDLASSESDHLSIYDDDEGKLKRRFSFHPTTAKLDPPIEFRIDAIEDLDGDASIEIAGGFRQRFVDGYGPVVPVVVRWDSAKSSYLIQPLIPKKPRLRRALHPGIFGSGQRNRYRKIFTLRDDESGRVLKGYSVDEFAVTKSSFFSPTLAASFIFRQKYNAEPRPVYEIKVWSLDMAGPRVGSYECYFPRGTSSSLIRRFAQSPRLTDRLRTIAKAIARAGC
jgi:hypothetical protein